MSGGRAPAPAKAGHARANEAGEAIPHELPSAARGR